MKKKFISATLILGLLMSPVAAFADAAVGDQIVTLGTNLNQQQRQEVLSYFGAKQDAQIIDVDISEERAYLSGKVPEAQIGNSTNSCAMITYTSKNSGVNVTTHNINFVTPDAYKSAILTAGITDADVKITAPMEVSGTGALTGILKAYEVSTGERIDEDVKQAATSELVTNAELGEAIGDQNANELINGIKQEIAEQNPQTEADYRAIIDQILAQLGVTLTPEQYQDLLDLVKELAKLDINWSELADNVSGLVGQAADYLQTEEGQGFWNRLQGLMNDFFNWVRGLFGGGNDTQADKKEDASVTEESNTQQTTTPVEDHATSNQAEEEAPAPQVQVEPETHSEPAVEPAPVPQPENDNIATENTDTVEAQ